jgi:hypothetical protein
VLPPLCRPAALAMPVRLRTGAGAAMPVRLLSAYQCPTARNRDRHRLQRLANGDATERWRRVIGASSMHPAWPTDWRYAALSLVPTDRRFAALAGWYCLAGRRCLADRSGSAAPRCPCWTALPLADCPALPGAWLAVFEFVRGRCLCSSCQGRVSVGCQSLLPPRCWRSRSRISVSSSTSVGSAATAGSLRLRRSRIVCIGRTKTK